MGFRYCEACEEVTDHKNGTCLNCNSRQKTSEQQPKKSRKWIVVVRILVLALVGAAIVIYPYYRDARNSYGQHASRARELDEKLSAYNKPLGDTPGAGCLELAKPHLLDPKSAYLVNERVKNGRVYIEYRAKNRMGGYIPGYESCAMKGDTITKADEVEYVIEKSREIR